MYINLKFKLYLYLTLFLSRIIFDIHYSTNLGILSLFRFSLKLKLKARSLYALVSSPVTRTLDIRKCT